MRIKRLFSSCVAVGMLSDYSRLNRRLWSDIKQVMSQDRLGRRWSKDHYSCGYTSYGSVDQLQHRFPSFGELEEKLSCEVEQFGKNQRWNTRGMQWQMTNCWANVMPEGVHHTSHLHPHATVSGVYYVSAPNRSVCLKLEDPRLPLMMSAPPREVYERVTPKKGMFVLFESWMRHEVPPNESRSPRVSVSFNYSLQAESL